MKLRPPASLRPAGLRRRSLLAAALAVAGTAQAQAPAGEGGYRFSPVPQQAIPLVAAYWNPILAWVSARSGVRLTLKISRTSAETTSYVLGQEVEFVFTNHLFSPEREQLGWKVIGRRLTPPVHGQLVVPAESPITELAQLEGKDVAFPGPEALVAYKVPYAHLLSRKIAAKPVFGGNMDGALAQLYSGKVAAAGANSQLVEGHARREGRKYRVLWSSEPFHDLALMAAAKVPEKDVKAVAAAFAEMHKDPKGLEILNQVSQQIGLTVEAHFITSDGSEYGAYRRFYQTAPATLR
ncbi:MAG: phosphate/phosphite/phosphonate ABC transporter substrate-binding protein [Burkholderiales bacterium]|nr:phosphate/phosphite/phosphonate ABC transporter substrate-binding protein [Burkholderiales bacterium]